MVANLAIFFEKDKKKKKKMELPPFFLIIAKNMRVKCTKCKVCYCTNHNVTLHVTDYSRCSSLP